MKLHIYIYLYIKCYLHRKSKTSNSQTIRINKNSAKFPGTKQKSLHKHWYIKIKILTMKLK